MAKNGFGLAMLVAFGMAVVGCGNGDDVDDWVAPPPVDLGPYPNEIEISFRTAEHFSLANAWEGDTLTGAVLTLTFSPVTRPPLGTTGVFSGNPVSITPADLAWLQPGSVDLQPRSGGGDPQRTVSVTGVSARQSGNNVEVLLTLTRSAVPPPAAPGFHNLITVDFDVAISPDFESRFDEIRWMSAVRFFMF
ncbi:MAG: hypothetical protein FWB79_02330 [Treponema sp.]|nr:hypothetical protein [Treponema sp.]